MGKTFLLILLGLSLNSFATKPAYIFVNSDKTIKVEFDLSQSKTPIYKVFYNNKLAINTSELGIIRKDANLYADLKIISVSKSKPVQLSYSMLQGKRKNITYSANEYTVQFKNNKGNLMAIIFQISSDVMTLRHHFTENSKDIKKITDEKTSYIKTDLSKEKKVEIKMEPHEGFVIKNQDI